MRFKEYLTEWSWVSPAVDKALLAKGYKLLGSGADQWAYLEPGTGHVLKIFGTKKAKWHEGYTKDHLMFKFWVNYCEQHSGNQFLPKFYGWEGFELAGKSYLQIRMEKLKKLPMGLSQALHEIAQYIGRSPTKERVDLIIKNVQDLNDEDNRVGKFLTDVEVLNIERLVVLLGEKEFTLLLSTIADLAEIANKNGWHFDLHGGNFMHRSDGIPIIVDPWVL